VEWSGKILRLVLGSKILRQLLLGNSSCIALIPYVLYICVALITYIHVGIGCAQDDSGATFLAHMLLRGSFVAIYVIRGTAGTRIINLIFALISVYLRINYFFIVLGDVMDITSGARRQDPSAALRMTSYKSCRVTDTCN